jgi:hypothetical protein
MFRATCTTLILLVTIASTFSQDKILLPDQTVIEAKIFSSEGDTVLYTVNEEQHVLAKRDVLALVYENGQAEIFNKYKRKLIPSDNNWTKHTIAIGFIWYLPIRSYVYSDPDGFDFQAGYGASLMYQYNFPKTRHLSLRAILDYQSSKANGDTLGTGFARVQLVPLMTGLKVYPARKKNFYIVGDIGAAFSAYQAEFDSDDLVKSEKNNNVGFSAGFGFGFDIKLTDKWHLEIDHTVRYLKVSGRDDSTSNFYFRVLYNL